MAPRSSDPAGGARRGSDRGAGSDRIAGSARKQRKTSSLAEAKAYSPRGRRLYDQPKDAGRGDPFRPALQVLQGGAEAPSKRAARTSGTRAATSKGAGRKPKQRAGTGVRPQRRPAQPRRTAPPAPVARRLPRLGDPRRRLRLGAFLSVLLFVVIAGRLIELQLTDAKTYAAQGLHARLQTVPLAAPRGTIYDSGGKVLAHSVEARYVYADPEMVEQPDEAATALSPLLGVPRSTLLIKLNRHKRDNGEYAHFEYLARGVDISVGEQIKALELAGIGVRKDEKRQVPGHDLGANLIGFTGQELRGLAGLEFGYDDVLRGLEGERSFEIGDGDLATEIPGGYQVETPARPGSSIRLTINRDVQYYVQHVLSERMKQTKATIGSAVVLDVATGEVLAQASYPGYDAAEPFKAAPSQRGDTNIDFVVDPGSVAKVLTVGAALEEGLLTPDSTVTVGPTIRKGDQTYRDTHPFPNGTNITLPALLAFSSNVGTIRIADRLGAQKLYEYQRRFCLGEPTGEGLPGEAAGLVQPPENWSGSSYGSIPIGNGISVTPLQMAAAYNAIANNGVWVAPHLVSATIAPDGRVTPTPPVRTQRVLSPQNAAALRTMLEAVTTVDGATGRRAAIPGYRVAGKTGTGARVENGTYQPGEVASFIGMAPADNPRFVIAVFAHSPSGEGGKVAAPAFKDMMAFTLGHYTVAPNRTPSPTFVLTRDEG